MLLETGLEALKQGRHQDAIQQLKEFCQDCTQIDSEEYLKARMGLVKAYHRLGQTQQALTLAQTTNWVMPSLGTVRY
ncbi:MAG TPA: tetratricopeptide repeat protein [Coleofasciculaceae cyanobacterium]